MSYIYLIGPLPAATHLSAVAQAEAGTGTGAAKTQDEDMARAFEQVSGYHRCTQKQYIQRMREMRALDLPAGTPISPTKTNQPNICPTCGTPREWIVCDTCGGQGYIGAHDFNPSKYNPDDMEMCCNQCYGISGWYQCPNHHSHLPARAVAAGGSARARLQGRGQAQADPTETNHTEGGHNVPT